MTSPDLMADEMLYLGGIPTRLSKKLPPIVVREGNTRSEQCLRVRLHMPHAIAYASFAEVASVGMGHDRAPDKARGMRCDRTMGKEHGDGAGTNGEIGEIGLEALAVKGGIPQGLKSGFQKRSAIFSRDDEGRSDHAGFDLTGRYPHGIQESETGIGDVEDLGMGRQGQEMMDVGSGSGFQTIPADGAMDQQVDRFCGGPGTALEEGLCG